MRNLVALACVWLACGWLVGCSGSSDPCGSCDDGVACTRDSCDPASKACVHTPDDGLCGQGQRCDPAQGCLARPPCEVDADCDDRVFCNGEEFCQAGFCQSRPRDCADTVDCTEDLCDEPMKQCIHRPLDSRCAASERCDRNLGCQPRQPCTQDFECDDRDPCTLDRCQERLCQNTPQSGTPCDDGLFCTEDDTCAAGSCLGVPRVCEPPADACEQSECNEASRQCEVSPRPQGAPCEDGDWCTVGETCQGGECLGGQPRECTGSLPFCQAWECDPDQQACLAGPHPDREGQACDDRDPCTLDDICVGGECLGEPNLCDDGNPCTLDRCEPGSGGCVWEPDPRCIPTGEPCRQDEECVGGVCLQPADGFPAGACSQYCGPGTQPCVGDAVCVTVGGEQLCLARCPLTGGDTCPRVGYMCVGSGQGSIGACVPGEDLCLDNLDNDSDGQTDCDDFDCAADPACLQTCTPAATLACGQTLEGTLTGASRYRYYLGCSDHDHGGPEAVYAFTATETGVVSITLDSGGWFLAALVVLEDNCWPQLACRAYDAQFGVGSERVRLNVTAGQRFYVIVEGHDQDEAGPYTLSAACGDPELCQDGLDNDLDGLTDCQDPDCAREPACEGHEYNCNDEIDNDDDGEADCDDPDCFQSPVCLPETDCQNWLDDDQDGLTDCQDPDCAAVGYCQAERLCQDGRDNDADGFTDCEDDDCQVEYECQAERHCRDGRDNDADGWTDCDDDDCVNTPVCQPEAPCDDGVDNDQDGLTDCDDPDCGQAVNCADRCSAAGSAQGCWDQKLGSTTGRPNAFQTYGCDDFYTLNGPEMVYTFTPTASGTVFFYLAPQFDAFLFIYQDECVPVSAEHCLGYVFAGAQGFEVLELEVQAGRTYYAIIDSETAAQQGNFIFRPDCIGQEICNDGVDNDMDGLTDCADTDPEDCWASPHCTTVCTASEELDCGAWLIGDSTTSTSRIAHYDGMCPADTSGGYPGGEKIYHYRNDTRPMHVLVEIEASLFTDIALIVMRDTCTPQRTTEICEDDRTGWDPLPPREFFDLYTEPGVDYYIAVDSFQSGRKHFFLSVTCTPQ
jgi:hypothetical protein